METFELAVITKAKLCQAIQAAKKRIVFAAPGVDEDVAHALAQAYEKLPSDSIYIHIDPSARALLSGYGTTKGIEILANLRKAFIAETWRLGLLIADDVAFIYAPTAEAKEPPPKEGNDPNGVILHGIVVDYFDESIRGPAQRPVLIPLTPQADRPCENEAIGRTNPDTLKTSTANIPQPREARLMDMVRRMFKIIEFRHSLTLADKRIKLTARDFGIRTEEVDPQLSISFRIISGEHRKAINRIMNEFDREIGRWAEGTLLRIPLPRLQVISYENPQQLEAEFGKVRTEIENKVRNWFSENYAQVLSDSASIVERFLKDDLFDRVNPQRGVGQRRMSDDEFRRQWVEIQSQRYQLPSANQVLGSLKINFTLHDISAEMLADSVFRKALERDFDCDLEEMLDREENPV